MKKTTTLGPAVLLWVALASPAGAQDVTAPEAKTDLGTVRALFGGADANKDGQISAAEAAVAGISHRVAQALDHDGDGALSAAEFTVGYRQALVDARRPVGPDLEAEATRLLALRKQQDIEVGRQRILRGADGPASRRLDPRAPEPGARPATPAPAPAETDDARRRLANARDGSTAPAPAPAPATSGDARQRLANAEAEQQAARLRAASAEAEQQAARLRAASAEAEQQAARLRAANSGDAAGDQARRRLAEQEAEQRAAREPNPRTGSPAPTGPARERLAGARERETQPAPAPGAGTRGTQDPPRVEPPAQRPPPPAPPRTETPSRPESKEPSRRVPR